MSSPRKYSSPYLKGLPGLPANSSPSRTKKRSKTSITKTNPSQNQEACANDNNTISCSQVNFDKSSGDVDANVLKEFQGAAQPTDITPNKSDITIQTEDTSDLNCQDASTPIAEVKDADISAKMGSSTSKPDQDACAPDSRSSSTEDLTVQIERLKPQNHSLKSILKTPSPYHSTKPKPMKLDVGKEASKKPNAKDSKFKSGKFVSKEKEKEHPSRSLTNHKYGGPSAPISKIDLFQQAQMTSAKSPSRRRNVAPGKFAEKIGIARLQKKAVRFSNKIDVYHVPYEARAGSRACDWQRNMLEQRVQTFRQLMKDVGSEELDVFGSGMVFPGYPYHLPNPNLGRVRNFKF